MSIWLIVFVCESLSPRPTPCPANGVTGKTNSPEGAGVFGGNDAPKGPANGVTGKTNSPEGAAVQGFTDHGNGVLGTTKGIGKSGVFGENHGDPGRQVAQVVGVTGRANSAHGLGVLGSSEHGTGVSGSGGQYGGVFDGGRAPLRLAPSNTAETGPPKGGYHQKGEFFVAGDGSLFYCIADNTWKRVQLLDI